MCGRAVTPPTPPSSGLPPRMQKGRGADTLSSGHSQGSGKEAQTKLSLRQQAWGMEEKPTPGSGNRKASETADAAVGRRTPDEARGSAEGRLGEAGGGQALSDPPRAKREAGRALSRVWRELISVHATAQLAGLERGRVTLPGARVGKGEPWSRTAGVGGVSLRGPILLTERAREGCAGQTRAQVWGSGLSLVSGFVCVQESSLRLAECSFNPVFSFPLNVLINLIWEVISQVSTKHEFKSICSVARCPVPLSTLSNPPTLSLACGCAGCGGQLRSARSSLLHQPTAVLLSVFHL